MSTHQHHNLLYQISTGANEGEVTPHEIFTFVFMVHLRWGLIDHINLSDISFNVESRRPNRL